MTTSDAKYGYSAQTEALHMLVLDGFDPTTGDVNAYGHFTLILLPRDQHVLLWDGTEVVVPAGNYVVSEDSQGFVDSEIYATADQAREVFEYEKEAYGEWASESDMEAEHQDRIRREPWS